MRSDMEFWKEVRLSFLLTGGRINPGQLIGATDARGEYAVERRLGVQDFVASLYRHLGIDASRIEIPNFSGRPIPLQQDCKPIPELLSRASTLVVAIFDSLWPVIAPHAFIDFGAGMLAWLALSAGKQQTT